MQALPPAPAPTPVPEPTQKAAPNEEYLILKRATNNFSDQNKIGQGGFGSVLYKVKKCIYVYIY